MELMVAIKNVARDNQGNPIGYRAIFDGQPYYFQPNEVMHFEQGIANILLNQSFMPGDRKFNLALDVPAPLPEADEVAALPPMKVLQCPYQGCVSKFEVDPEDKRTEIGYKRHLVNCKSKPADVPAGK